MDKMNPKIYLETTIISYMAAHPSRDLIIAANQQVTTTWWNERKPNFDVFVSQLVIEESTGGDEDAAKRRLALLEGISLLAVNELTIKLAEELVASGAIPQKAAADGIHIAIAACNGMDYLLTWNFKHIANATMRANRGSLSDIGLRAASDLFTARVVGGINDATGFHCRTRT